MPREPCGWLEIHTYQHLYWLHRKRFLKVCAHIHFSLFPVFLERCSRSFPSCSLSDRLVSRRQRGEILTFQLGWKGLVQTIGAERAAVCYACLKHYANKSQVSWLARPCLGEKDWEEGLSQGVAQAWCTVFVIIIFLGNLWAVFPLAHLQWATEAKDRWAQETTLI